MSHPSLKWQAVCYVYVTLVTHMAGGALRKCNTGHLLTELLGIGGGIVSGPFGSGGGKDGCICTHDAHATAMSQRI
jgi:hypothetical protein